MDIEKIFSGARFDEPDRDDWVIVSKGRLLLTPCGLRWLFDDKKQAQGAFRNNFRWRVSQEWGLVTNTTAKWGGRYFNSDVQGWKTFLQEAEIQFMTYGQYVDLYKKENHE